MPTDARYGGAGWPFAPDRSLRIRMVLTLALVAILPFAFVYVMQFLVNTVGYWLLGWIGLRPQTPLALDPVVVGIAVLGVLAVQYRYGPRVIAHTVRATEPAVDRYPELAAAVTRLAQQASVPTPTIRVFETRLPNAFAVGTPENGTIVVSTGLLDLLDEQERDGVIAHELAHLQNRDASLMTVAWLLPMITHWLVGVATRLLESLLGGRTGPARGSSQHVDRYGFSYNSVRGTHRSGGGHSGRSGPGMLFALVIFGIGGTVLIAVSGLFWAGSVLVFRILSRYREFAADRAAATLTGSPAALASALEKLDDGVAAVPSTDLRNVEGGVEALYIVPLASDASGTESPSTGPTFPETHPPTARRIERLLAMVDEGR